MDDKRSPAAIAAGCKKAITDSVNNALSVFPCWVVEMMLENIYRQVVVGAEAERAALAVGAKTQTGGQPDGNSTQSDH